MWASWSSFVLGVVLVGIFKQCLPNDAQHVDINPVLVNCGLDMNILLPG